MSLLSLNLTASLRRNLWRAVVPSRAVARQHYGTLIAAEASTPYYLVANMYNQFWDTSIWLIKRTFQPSIIRKKRKMGFLVRQRTVGGRRTLARRKAKGRWRLGGGI